MSPRLARAGLALAVLYVAVAALTSAWSSRPVLPLFDGFAPPTPYAWVTPPPERGGDNVTPARAERDFALGPSGAPASNVSTEDGQAIVGLVDGSVPASPPEMAVRVTVTPVDGLTLGPLPPGLRVVSNAYRVELAYVPSAAPVTRLATNGTVALTAADTGDRLLYSADGQGWTELTARPYGQDHGLFAELAQAGWFVVASSSGPAGAAGDGGSDALRTVLLVMAAAVPIVGAVLVVRLPSPVPATPAPRAGRPARAVAKARAKRRRKGRR